MENNNFENFESALAYRIYFGLFDQLSHKQEIRTEDALNIISDYLAANFDGATVFSGYGIYKHDDGTTVQEPSLIIELLDTDYEIIQKMISEIKFILNQESVLISVSELKYSFQ